VNLGRPLSPEPSTLIVMVDDFPQFEGQVLGRELELQLTAVVTNAPKEGHPPAEGGIPSRVVLTIVRAEITQTT
jgi:hypothetical protein